VVPFRASSLAQRGPAKAGFKPFALTDFSIQAIKNLLGGDIAFDLTIDRKMLI
jgi:hypothetical protein